MNDLAKELERFNRKERNLVIRDILDCVDEPRPLGPEFCERLAIAVEIDQELLKSAWWTTDFHFDWLAGALLSFMRGERTNPQCNHPKVIDLRPGSSIVKLVMGNQEDIDLVIVVYDATLKMYHLILIEAKAYGRHDGKQFKRKMRRFELLHDLYKEDLKPGSPQESESPHNVTFYYLPFSKNKPPSGHFAMRFPSQSPGVNNIEHTRLELRFPKSCEQAETCILTVMRCKADGLQDSEGTCWRCAPLRSKRLTDMPTE